MLFSIMAVHLRSRHPCEGSGFSECSPAPCLSGFVFGHSHVTGCGQWCLPVIDLRFPDDRKVEGLFQRTHWPLVSSVGKCPRKLLA